jgi:hypothetical protein
MSKLSRRVSTIFIAAILLAGCGLTPPRLAEVWEAQDVRSDMVLSIKRNILCETIAGIREINRIPTSFGPPIPDNYSVQLQLTLTIAESTDLSSNLTYNQTLTNGSQSGITIGRNWSVGLSGDLSSTATRTDTSYSYWSVKQIAGPGKNKAWCEDPEWPMDRRSTSPLVQSDLGITRFLSDQVKAADLLHSSKPGAKAPDKIDVYSYDLKFVVVSTGGISPQFKLIPLSGGGTPILNLNRTRTHELLLTFGPSAPGGFQPSPFSFNQHLNTQLGSTLSRGPGGF